MALLTGCGSLKGRFEAMKEPGYDGKLDRVLIVYENEETSAQYLGHSFADDFLTRFTGALTAQGVHAAIVRPRERELDSAGQIRVAFARARPRQMLNIGLTRAVDRAGWRMEGDKPSAVLSNVRTFAFTLTDVARNRAVWRGSVHYDIVPDAKTVADQFTAQLAAEGFLGGTQARGPLPAREAMVALPR
jgi:hypothetical protein